MALSGIDVRPIRIRDLVRLRSMRTDLLMPDLTLGPISQRMADPLAALPVSRRFRKCFVASVDGTPAGLIDLIADPANHRWLISRIATSIELPSDDEQTHEAIWRELAIQSIRAAGASRAKRIHAVLPEPSDVTQSLIQTGFSIYAQDTVLMAQRLPPDFSTGVTRRQDPSDVWSIHQLYHSVTPKPVQFAEALTSNYWEGDLPGQSQARGYVIEDGYGIVAHCRVTALSCCPVLHVMVHSDAFDLLQPMVADVVADVLRGNRDHVSIVVPDYLQEYISPLRELGFEDLGRQSRLVKHTVVPRRIQFRGVEELAREVPEQVAAGTPTFYYAGNGAGSSRPREYTELDNSLERDGFS